MDHGAVDLCESRGDRREAVWHVCGCRIAQDRCDLVAGALQPLDVGCQFDIHFVQRGFRGLAHHGDCVDLRQGHAQVSQPADAQKSHQVPHLVLLVAVVASLGLLEKAEAVIVANRVDRGARERREFARAPGHGRLPQLISIAERMPRVRRSFF